MRMCAGYRAWGVPDLHRCLETIKRAPEEARQRSSAIAAVADSRRQQDQERDDGVAVSLQPVNHLEIVFEHARSLVSSVVRWKTTKGP